MNDKIEMNDVFEDSIENVSIDFNNQPQERVREVVYEKRLDVGALQNLDAATKRIDELENMLKSSKKTDAQNEALLRLAQYLPGDGAAALYDLLEAKERATNDQLRKITDSINSFRMELRDTQAHTENISAKLSYVEGSNKFRNQLKSAFESVTSFTPEYLVSSSIEAYEDLYANNAKVREMADAITSNKNLKEGQIRKQLAQFVRNTVCKYANSLPETNELRLGLNKYLQKKGEAVMTKDQNKISKAITDSGETAPPPMTSSDFADKIRAKIRKF